MVCARALPICVLSGMVLTLCVGCPDTRTSNQGGGTVLTVAAKLQSNPSDPPIGELNADEWQIVADNLPLLAQMLGYPLPENLVLPTLTRRRSPGPYRLPRCQWSDQCLATISVGFQSDGWNRGGAGFTGQPGRKHGASVLRGQHQRLVSFDTASRGR